MVHSFQLIQAKPSPIVTYTRRSVVQGNGYLEVPYTGETLTAFLKKHNADPFAYRQFLMDNQIGSVFDDLKEGQLVRIRPITESEAFPQHRYV